MNTKEKSEQIEKLVKDILHLAYSDLEEIEPPIKLYKLADMLNIEIEEVQFEDDDVIGELEIDPEDDSNATIKVNVNDPVTRQRFTIAHELGHYILEGGLSPARRAKNKSLRKKIRIDKEFNIVDESKNEENETKANMFAISLLMPSWLVIKYWNVRKDINFIATIFGVSSTGAHWRLYNLNLINIPPQK